MNEEKKEYSIEIKLNSQIRKLIVTKNDYVKIEELLEYFRTFYYFYSSNLKNLPQTYEELDLFLDFQYYYVCFFNKFNFFSLYFHFLFLLNNK